jgi:heterodisulfide reductase subunit B
MTYCSASVEKSKEKVAKNVNKCIFSHLLALIFLVMDEQRKVFVLSRLKNAADNYCQILHCTPWICVIRKGKAIPVTGREGP